MAKSNWVVNFWSKVNRRGPGGCWIWEAARDSSGYGTISYQGKTLAAHRVAWALFNGKPLASAPCVLHSCDNGAGGCVNPSHLSSGTVAKNNREARERGRHVAGRSFGQANGSAKITDAQRSELEELWKRRHDHEPRLTQAAIAKKFGISRARVGEIVRALDSVAD